ncbi:MAG: hypothetical protein ACFFDD_16030, partial [Promethearchaeota archaeon]
FEDSLTARESISDSNKLVNPEAFPEGANHVITSTHELEAAIGNIGSPIVILTACLLGGTELPLMLMEHGAVAVTGSPRTVYFQPAGMLSVLVTQSLCAGSTAAEALSYGITVTSSDYSYPSIPRVNHDYANQQVLFGDPSVRLYAPAVYSHVTAIDPLEASISNHVPGHGTNGVVALGASSYLPATLTSLSISFDYYEAANYSEFLQLLSLRQVVLIEPDTLTDLGASLSSSSSDLETYVRNGGTLVIFGVSENISWLPWPVSYQATGSGTSITIVDTTHPLLNSPNTLTSVVDYAGYFSSVWTNFSILATDGSNPVIVAGVVGSGKVALTTTFPAGISKNVTIENAVTWSIIPSITLYEISLSEEIIWAGDQVLITIELTDLVGNDIESADLNVWLNSSQIDAVEDGSGFYTVTLTGDWTRNNVGLSHIHITATKAGYDTLTLTLEQFLLVRPFPWLMLAIIGGGLFIVAGVWIYWKKTHGESIGWKREREPRDRKQEAEQRKKDSKSDVKEFFGV